MKRRKEKDYTVCFDQQVSGLVHYSFNGAMEVVRPLGLVEGAHQLDPLTFSMHAMKQDVAFCDV